MGGGFAFLRGDLDQIRYRIFVLFRGAVAGRAGWIPKEFLLACPLSFRRFLGRKR